MPGVLTSYDCTCAPCKSNIWGFTVSEEEIRLFIRFQATIATTTADTYGSFRPQKHPLGWKESATLEKRQKTRLVFVKVHFDLSIRVSYPGLSNSEKHVFSETSSQ